MTPDKISQDRKKAFVIGVIKGVQDATEKNASIRDVILSGLIPMAATGVGSYYLLGRPLGRAARNALVPSHPEELDQYQNELAIQAKNRVIEELDADRHNAEVKRVLDDSNKSTAANRPFAGYL